MLNPVWNLGIKASHFARQQLDQVGLVQELEPVPYGSVAYSLPPATTTTWPEPGRTLNP